MSDRSGADAPADQDPTVDGNDAGGADAVQPPEKGTDWEAEAKRWEQLATQRDKRAKLLEDKAKAAADKAKAADDALAELDALKREKMTDAEKADADRKRAQAEAEKTKQEAIAEAATKARTEALAEVAGRVAGAELRAVAAAARVPEPTVVGLLAFLDLGKLIKAEDGSVDDDAVRQLVGLLAPPPGPETTASGQPAGLPFPDLGQGRKSGPAPVGLGDNSALLRDINRKLGIT